MGTSNFEKTRSEISISTSIKPSIEGNNRIVTGFNDETIDGLSIILESSIRSIDSLILHVAGRIDNYNSAQFERVTRKTIICGFRRLIFDCTNLSYVSSTGIGTFLAIDKEMQELHGNMFLSCVPSRVHEIFEILGFTSVLTFCDDIDDAGIAEPPKAVDVIFPITFPCPGCGKRLKAPKPGKYQCSVCKSRFIVQGGGAVRQV
jgi:anti-anti-sigma factor